MTVSYPSPFTQMFQTPAVIAMSIAATRMHRSLTDFSHSVYDTFPLLRSALMLTELWSMLQDFGYLFDSERTVGEFRPKVELLSANSARQGGGGLAHVFRRPSANQDGPTCVV